MVECFFKCSLSATKLTYCQPQRIIEASKKRNDNIHFDLEESLKRDPDLRIQCHRNCVSTYTSNSHIERYLKRNGLHNRSSSEPAAKRTRRSDVKSFKFQTDCLFCGHECDLNPDPRNPSRWRKAHLCKTAERGIGCQTFKDRILEVCFLRNDAWARDITVRVQGAVSDLHAADARYHDDCRLRFMSSRNVDAANNLSTSANESCEKDVPLMRLVNDMKADKSSVWTSIDLQNMYASYEGIQLSRRQIISNLKNHFGEELLILSSPGLADIVLFRNKAGELLKVVTDDEAPIPVEKLAKQIERECKQLYKDSKPKRCYTSRIDKELAVQSISDSLLCLLSEISGHSNLSLPVILIGNMITSMVVKHPTDLQIALGVLVREKKLLETFYDFGVTCSYDETLRFKSSAASAASSINSTTTRPITDSQLGLVQAVADNLLSV